MENHRTLSSGLLTGVAFVILALCVFYALVSPSERPGRRLVRIIHAWRHRE
jgi:hypothetical protein